MFSCLRDSIFTADLQENDEAVHHKTDENECEPIQIGRIIVHRIILKAVSLEIGLVTGELSPQSYHEKVENR